MFRRRMSPYGFPTSQELGGSAIGRAIRRFFWGTIVLGAVLLAGIALGIFIAPATGDVLTTAQAATSGETVIFSWSGGDENVNLSLAQAKCATYAVKLNNLSSKDMQWEQLVDGKSYTSGTMRGKASTPIERVPMKAGTFRFAIRYTIAGHTTTIFDYNVAGTQSCK